MSTWRMERASGTPAFYGGKLSGGQSIFRAVTFADQESYGCDDGEGDIHVEDDGPTVLFRNERRDGALEDGADGAHSVDEPRRLGDVAFAAEVLCGGAADERIG